MRRYTGDYCDGDLEQGQVVHLGSEFIVVMFGIDQQRRGFFVVKVHG